MGQAVRCNVYKCLQRTSPMLRASSPHACRRPRDSREPRSSPGSASQAGPRLEHDGLRGVPDPCVRRDLGRLHDTVVHRHARARVAGVRKIRLELVGDGLQGAVGQAAAHPAAAPWHRARFPGPLRASTAERRRRRAPKAALSPSVAAAYVHWLAPHRRRPGSALRPAPPA